MKTLESPLSFPDTSNAPKEAVPDQAGRIACGDRERHDGFAITENLETGRFDAKVAFELSGVALNGCSILNQPSQEASRSADRRLSRLLHALDGEAAVEFIFGGGGTMDFSWRINGWIRDVDSKHEALLKAQAKRAGQRTRNGRGEPATGRNDSPAFATSLYSIKSASRRRPA